MRWFCWLRTVIFYVFFGLWTAAWSTWVIITVRLLPKYWRHTYAVSSYGFIAVWLCRLTCGIRWRIEGKENIPLSPCVIASNHQSTWETFYLQNMFTPQATVLKKELLKVPFFGWALKALDPIAINRADPREAMKEMNVQGVEALKKQYWVMVFPEGSRYNWPTPGRYTRGAVTLASKIDLPVLPIVHDAGRYWPNKRWLKTPGEIVVHIGEAIPTAGRTTKEVNDELEAWTKMHMPQR